MTRRGAMRLAAAGAARIAVATPAQRQPVLMDQDGGMPDDYLSVALLQTMETIETLGVVVTPADCYLEPAVSATRKILALMGRSGIPIGASRIEGTHPFPAEWRRGAYAMDRLPILNGRISSRVVLPAEAGERFTARTLRASTEPVTMLVTGPLSTLAEALRNSPEIESKISRIVWMGGALNAPGNVDRRVAGGHDGSAEWNSYWDPHAAARVWRTNIPIILCPLDITNRVPVTKQFIDQLRAQSRFPLSKLASESYQKVLTKTAMFFWDILTTSYLGRPEMFQLREWQTVIVTDGPSAGRTKIQPGGRKILALDRVDLDQFYSYLLKQWRQELNVSAPTPKEPSFGLDLKP